jgi:DnaJ family protein C protein 8
LNPFEVLQIDPYASIEDVKKKYRKLSMYVHPDKNNHDKERAQVAFEAVNRAYKLLSDEKERKQCLEVVDEARERVDAMVVIF